MWGFGSSGGVGMGEQSSGVWVSEGTWEPEPQPGRLRCSVRECSSNKTVPIRYSELPSDFPKFKRRMAPGWEEGDARRFCESSSNTGTPQHKGVLGEGRTPRRAGWGCPTAPVSREQEQRRGSALLLQQAAIPAWCSGKTMACGRSAEVKPAGSEGARPCLCSPPSRHELSPSSTSSPERFLTRRSATHQGSCPCSFVHHKIRCNVTFPERERQSPFDEFQGTTCISFGFITLVVRLQKCCFRLLHLTRRQPPHPVNQQALPTPLRLAGVWVGSSLPALPGSPSPHRETRWRNPLLF